MPTKTCPKCGGTGHLRHFAHVDGGKCWACTDKAPTYSQEVLADDEALRRWEETRKERRQQRRAARGR